MNLGFDVVPVRKTAGPEDYQNGGYRGYDPDGDDRSPEQRGRAAVPHHVYEQSQHHPDCQRCGLPSRDHDDVPDWGGYKTSSTICGHPQCEISYMTEHGNAESHAIHRDKQHADGWHPNPHTHEEWKGNAELEREFKDDKTSSVTVTAKEVGYYVVSRNGVPISGPYATRSDAAPNMIEQRGAAVMFIGPGNSAEWDALKAKQFPFGLNTVNGSRKEAYEQYGENPYLECYSCGWNGNASECSVPGICPECFHKGLRDGSGQVFVASRQVVAEDQAYCRGCGLFGAPTHGSLCWQCKEKRSNGQPIEWRRTDKPKPRNHKASLEALAWGPDQHNPEVGLDFHEFPEDPEYIDPRDYEDDPWDEEEGDEDDIPQRWEASRHTAGTMADGKTPVRQHKFKEDSNWGDESGCTVCGQSKGHSNHTDRAQATSLLEERYATVRRLSSLRHFADEQDEAEDWEKQPKGLTDQVNNGMAPASEIQDPNPLAGQDLERTPRNLAEAALWAQAYDVDPDYESGLSASPCPECIMATDGSHHPDCPYVDDPWNGQENPLGRGWGDPPLGY
jgi:hypothetical protein